MLSLKEEILTILDKQLIPNLLSLIRKSYPNWSGFSDLSFVKDELKYKKAASSKAQNVLSEQELGKLIKGKNFREIIERFISVAQSTNLLFLRVPLKGDLSILYKSDIYNSKYSEYAHELFNLLYGTDESETRIESYSNYVQNNKLPNRWTFPTYFLFLCYPDTEIFIKPSVTKWLIQFAGLGNKIVLNSLPSGKTYSSIKELYNCLKVELHDYGPKDMIDIQSFIWVCADAAKKNRVKSIKSVNLPPLNHEIIDRIKSILDRKGQVILYGPPGTGKTYWAEKAANELASYSMFGKRYDQLLVDEIYTIVGNENDRGIVRMCCFHPAYGYEDFIEGYRPKKENDIFRYVLVDGIFKGLCRDASDNPQFKYYIIIDEINRGDIPRIFGELMTALEKDKRDMNIVLPLSGERLAVPKNVCIIGTMNTADRSISLLDAALRRRFGFMEFMPDSSILKYSTIEGIQLGDWLDMLNRRICKFLGDGARNLQIGHSYLLEENGKPISDFSKFQRIVHEEIIPLLEEYCYEDYYKLERILGDALVDANAQKIHHELFESNPAALLSALSLSTTEYPNNDVVGLK
jgi:hypothetical protein